MKHIIGLCSAYSLLYGVHKSEKLLDRAALNGAKTVSICDINNLYGLHSFIEAAKERNMRPIIGAALNPAKSGETAVFCFVVNREGFGRLCEILTAHNKAPAQFDPIPYLIENSTGLILASPIPGVLETLSGKVHKLYAAITPESIQAAPAANRLTIPLCYIDNSLFLDKSDYTTHKVLRAIALLKTTGNLQPEELAGQDRILHQTTTPARILKTWPEAIRGTEEIAELCQFNTVFNGWIFPGYHTSGKSINEELRDRVYSGNDKRYGELSDREIGRIEYELEIINGKGFAPYFLTIDDIVKMASRTCGRGSGAASIVSYGLNITNVDPLRHNLYFERFLTHARPDPPDLDIDFAWDERDGLIKAVIAKFGQDYCARVANHNFFRNRSAFRETAKAYGYADAEITQAERRMYQTGNNTANDTPQWQEILQTAAKIEGLPRGLGMHCGGIVITPLPICRYAPIEKSAEGFPLLAWEKDGAEAAGFVKIDLLGNRSLAVIRDAIANLAQQGIEIQPDAWQPIDDPQTKQALAIGDSMGVFYIESPAMRQLQKKTGKGDFEHIVIHSSIIRPAANKYISEYVKRLKGAAWEPLHPRLEEILKETYGILCYQEDVSKTAVALAGFNEAEADKLRKIIAKKAAGAKLAEYKLQFFEGCLKNSVNEETTAKIWEMMLSFDGYSFCKPHSASYAMVSFQSAYLRVHHPAEFMAAVLSNQGGYYRPHAYIAETRRMKLFTIGPCVNKSLWKYYGKGRDMVIGLMAIKGLSKSGAETIISERERNGDFTNLDNFSRRVKLSRDDIIALCPAGVFDSISDGAPRTIQARRLLGTVNAAGQGSQSDLFAAETAPKYQAKPAIAKPQKQESNNALFLEYQALGFLRNTHPLALWKDEVYAIKHRVKAIHLNEYIGRPVKMVGWPVTQKDVWTKDGLTMSFLSLEDETGLYETVIFPKIFDRYSKLLFDQRPLLVYGQVTNDEGAISLEVLRIETLGNTAVGETFALRYPAGWY